MKKLLVVILGPTAAGKTEVALALSKHFHTEIISADSRQFYRELNTGVAKPTHKQLGEVPHHFIGHRSIHDEYSAGDFEHDAIAVIEELFRNRSIVILVGGSGLFIRAVIEGLDRFPDIDESVANDLKKIFETEGLEGLQKLLKEHDPDYYEMVDRSNPRRLLRALGVTLSSGKPYSSFRKAVAKKRDFEVVKIGLRLPTEILYQRIDQRVDEMMMNGLLDEAKQLFDFRKLSSLQTVGYTELFDYLEGKGSMEESVQSIKQHTRNFAKRQMTWFRKEEGVEWFSPDKIEEMIDLVFKKVNDTEAA